MAADRHSLFIPCDYLGVYEELRKLRERAATFVEFGSGAGIATIMADLLGYEAYGIEIDPWLVDRSIELADQFKSNAIFVEGTFVSQHYQEEIEHLSEDSFTTTAGADAFEEIGLDLASFDLVFAYPWSGEEDWLRELIRRHARADTLLLTYDVTEGFRVYEGGD